AGNLLRLLQRPAPKAAEASRDPVIAEAQAGRALSTPVIDMHMHVLHEGLNGAGSSLRMSKGGPAGIFSRLKRLGVIGGGLRSWKGTFGVDAVNGNPCTREALDAAPGGYWGLGTVDPLHYSRHAVERQLREIYTDRRFIGMKPYHMYGVEYHDPK